ncbi:restriction endonuclease [Pseudanabaena sp. FACHB-1277]|uniref:Restriction endonuclease n=1 Tax=Pseudanabaena cinerea FACHB-1277 TaxID=2949581 RepID=A0A926Z5F6_9CYAN|nr:restriction endonuclease [Pseudanabaena cinerea]MBD2149538.1 restriction endonuclease [Pseudanabaena cinerea FACHB-1277]
MSHLDEALRQFEASEANLAKLEKLWVLLQKHTPKSVSFAVNPVYEDACRSYEQFLLGLPYIDGWKPHTLPLGLDEIALSRSDAIDVGELAAQIAVDRSIEQPGKELREYRFKFNLKRKHLIQKIVFQSFNEIENLLNELRKAFPIEDEDFGYKKIDHPNWQMLSDKIKQIDILLGSSVPRPPRWSDLHRHLSFKETNDLRDIINSDYPSVKEGLTKSLLITHEPIPVKTYDLGDLVASNPSGGVLTKLNWEKLSPGDFERLIFTLVASEQNYENPQLLTNVNAPDRGRDISAYRISQDGLSGTIRNRVILQCKHWRDKGISLTDISILKDQIKLWEPERVDVLIIATSGSFTADAVSFVENYNRSDSALRIEMWAESHLSKILASRPNIVADFSLR